MTGPPGHQARPSPPIGQARSPAGQAAQAHSAVPAQYHWWPIKGRRLGFEDPNRPLCRAAAVGCSGRRRRHPPTSLDHRRCQAAVPPCLQVSNPLSTSSSHGEHKTRPWRPANRAGQPVPGELRSIRTVAASRGVADPSPPAVPVALRGAEPPPPGSGGEVNPAPRAVPGGRAPLRGRLAAASA